MLTSYKHRRGFLMRYLYKIYLLLKRKMTIFAKKRSAVEGIEILTMNNSTFPPKNFPPFIINQKQYCLENKQIRTHLWGMLNKKFFNGNRSKEDIDHEHAKERDWNET